MIEALVSGLVFAALYYAASRLLAGRLGFPEGSEGAVRATAVAAAIFTLILLLFEAMGG